jgi:Cu/Zn superoxide dismutase
MHIHEAGATVEKRCVKVRSQLSPADDNRYIRDLGDIDVHSDGRVVHTKLNDKISLFGSDSIIGRTLVIHEIEDGRREGSVEDSRTTTRDKGDTDDRTPEQLVACCHIYQTYD